MNSSENYNALYSACQTGDFAAVKQLLPLLSFEELHHRVEPTEPFGLTPSLLTTAWSSKDVRIAQYLIDHGVMLSMKNKCLLSADEQQQQSSETNQQFKTVPFSLRDRLAMDVSAEEVIEWLSESHAHVAPLNRNRMKNHSVIEAAKSIRLDPRFQDVGNIQWYLEKACQTQNPEYLIQAYTTGGEFFRKINQALASDKDLGIGMNFMDDFTGIYLYVGCLLNDKYLKKFRYGGTSYRGMRSNQKYFETHYLVGRKAMIRSFTSTSKSREVAEVFADVPAPVGEVSILCIYIMPKYTIAGRYASAENLALDISSISVIGDEDEVLILPHISFEIVSITHLSTGLVEVELKYFGF